MDELKPCPFCGYNMATEDDCAYQKAGFVGPRTPVWEVCCGSTGCNASVSTTSRESAVTAWNTRAASGGDSASLEKRARELPDAIRIPLDALHADAGYLAGRVAIDGCAAPVVAEAIRKRVEETKVAITAALANQQGVEKDAARYRWLRDNCFINQNDDRDFPHAVIMVQWFDGEHVCRMHPGHHPGVGIPGLDSAIDAAMSAQPAGDVGREG